jgi:hypothetical protein
MQELNIRILNCLPVVLLRKTLKMGQTIDTETLVMNRKMTSGNNPENFKQHYDHGGSLQLHMSSSGVRLLPTFFKISISLS